MSADSDTLLQCYNNTLAIDQLRLKFGPSYSDDFNIFTGGDAEGPLLTTPDGSLIAAYMRIAVPGVGTNGAVTLTLNGNSLAQRSYQIVYDKLPGGSTVPGGHTFSYIEYDAALLTDAYSQFNIMDIIVTPGEEDPDTGDIGPDIITYGSKINYDLIAGTSTGTSASASYIPISPSFPSGNASLTSIRI